MKLEIILAIAWTSLCVGQRLKRSTVLTDESKRILEHFDFSNFDKQEALNYIDRQRYENQIRGKRSHTNLKGRYTDFPDKTVEKIESNEIGDDSEFGCKFVEKSNKKRQPNTSNTDASSTASNKKISKEDKFRNKRHRQRKKKRKSKKNFEQREISNDYDEDEEERRLWKRRRRRKKKRRYWDHWSEWSPCSVTCGKGRKIRWRKCIAKNCTTGELEMGEKTCQLPACSLLNKLLGI